MALNEERPVSNAIAKLCGEWLKKNFDKEIAAAVAGKPYGFKHVAAIFCQETAIYIYPLISKKLPTFTILKSAVFDASGDVVGTKRSAFPKNRQEFQAKYGLVATEMLIKEANNMRLYRGLKPATLLYKGYGLFQYDLQNISKDPSFFLEKKWYKIEECLSRLKLVLDEKYKIAKGDLSLSIERYNGSGVAARNYRNNVEYFASLFV